MKITRRAEARVILAENPDQRKYESAIPCKKCGSIEMRIEITKGELRAVSCWACTNKRVLNTCRKVRATPAGREKNKAYCRDYYASEAGGSKIRNAIYDKRKTQEGLQQHRAACLAWAKANPGRATAKAMKRHADKLQRTPKWADLKAISEFYANRPEGYHVDHIIPLCGELVSGLHVLENLQYLPASENCSKSNNFDPATFEA